VIVANGNTATADILANSTVLINGLEAYNATFADLSAPTSVVFYPPHGFNYTGYANVTVYNPDGGYGMGEDIIFFSIDCPQPGLIGRGTDCRACPYGGYCPGGNRIWPLPGWYVLASLSSLHCLKACASSC